MRGHAFLLVVPHVTGLHPKEPPENPASSVIKKSSVVSGGNIVRFGNHRQKSHLKYLLSIPTFTKTLVQGIQKISSRDPKLLNWLNQPSWKRFRRQIGSHILPDFLGVSIYVKTQHIFGGTTHRIFKKDRESLNPKNPDPSKIAILRTNTPLLYRFFHPSIGGSNRGFLGKKKKIQAKRRFLPWSPHRFQSSQPGQHPGESKNTSSLFQHPP